MDRESVLRQLRAWADGVDPSTGQVLPSDHPGQRPDTLRVIFAAVSLLEVAPALPAQASGRAFARGPRNAARPWSRDADDTLASGHAAGATIRWPAPTPGRTRRAA